MSSMLANFHFIRPVWLLLLPLATGLWWLWQRYADPLRGWRQQIAPALLHYLVVGPQAASRGPGVLLLVGWILLIVAIAGPTWRLEPSPFAEDATPLLIVLKAGSSMEQADPPPSRLERARLKIADLAKARMGQPLGLIAYAGSAHLVLPPTRDTAVVTSMAADISPAIMPAPGDRLDLALREAGRILAEGQQGGSIVVVADAVATDSQLLYAVQNELSIPVQFLAINSAGSRENKGLLAAATALKAKVEPLRIDGSDIAAIVRRAAGASVLSGDAPSNQWHEAGYWLVPLLGLLVLNGFRREKIEGEV